MHKVVVLKKCILAVLLVLPVNALAMIQIPDVNLHYSGPYKPAAFAPVQKTSIEKAEIEKSPVVDISQLLNQEQSIVRLTNNSNNPLNTGLSIRGFGDNAVANSLILIDGFPLINPSLLAPNFNSILLSDIERIDITQGSEGVLYGDQAVGGVVSIVTKQPQKKMLSGILGLGSFHQQFYSVFAGNLLKNGIFIKGFAYDNQTQNFRDNNDQRDKNIAIQAGVNYSAGMASLNLQAYENSVQMPSGLTEEQFYEDPSQSANSNNHMHFKTTLIQVLNKQSIYDDWLLETRLARYVTLGDGVVYTNFDRNDVMNSLEMRLSGQIQNYKILAGYEGFYSQYDFENIANHESANLLQNNIFARMTTLFRKELELIVGVRGASVSNHASPTEDVHQHSYESTWVSELGLAWYQNENWKYHIRRSGSFRFPKANEITWVAKNNETLTVQNGVSYEAGVEIKTPVNKTQLAIYRLGLEDEIAFNPSSTMDNPFGSYSNFPETVRYGITITDYFQVTQKLMLQGQLNWVDARFTASEFSGNSIPAVPEWNGNIGVKYEFVSDWSLKYTALYTGSAFASNDDVNEGKMVPAYWLQTLTLQYAKSFYIINIEAINLANQTFSTYTFYNVSTGENTYYPGKGRSILLTFKANID